MSQGTKIDVNPVLAMSARKCPAMWRADALARWFGSGRSLAGDGQVKPEHVPELAGLLDIDADGFLDSNEFYLAFGAADAAGFLEFSAEFDRAWQTQPAAGWSTAGDEVVLTLWKQALLEVSGLEVDSGGVSFDVDGLATLLVLQLLAGAGGPVGFERIRAEADKARKEFAGSHPGEEPGERPSGLELLVGFGAARRDGTSGSLTLLGRWIAKQLGALVMATAVNPDDDVATMIERLLAVPEPAALDLARPWLEPRSPVEAARLLLNFAAAADPFRRMVALMVARALGEPAASAWQEWAEQPGVGAYARIWLLESGAPPPISVRPDDGDWITVDVCASVLLTAPDRQPVRDFLTGQGIVEDPDVLLSRIDTVDHPFVQQVKALLRSW